MTTTRPRHKTIRADRLRNGDLMRCGCGTGYIKVGGYAWTDAEHVRVIIGGEAVLTLDADAPVLLSTHSMTDAELEEDR